MPSPQVTSESTSSSPSRSCDRMEDELMTISRSEFQRLLKNQEEMLKKQQLLEEKLANETNSRRKIRPSVKVKKAVHDVYNALVENEQKWDTSKPFGHPVNRDVNEEIKKAVKSQLNDDEAVIQVAMRTYFFTKRKEKKRETSGKAATFRVKQARRQRKQQKLIRRREVLKKCSSIEEEKKEKLKVVMSTLYMSSEDTDSFAEFSSSDDDLLSPGKPSH
ncbi:regulator of nonsense transcripts 3B-like [Ptychodera flava]|uniref:regulator of nonsense transcripts 3B-like n=1 Tax=Ptychodera flava TaxID=63121 RepID=UPI003969FDEF